MYLSKVAFSERVRTLNSGGDAQILSDPAALGVAEGSSRSGKWFRPLLKHLCTTRASDGWPFWAYTAENPRLLFTQSQHVDVVVDTGAENLSLSRYPLMGDIQSTLALPCCGL